jgi:hypothetical protein
MMLDNMMDEKTIGLLNDPVQLSKTLKQQFDEAASKRAKADEFVLEVDESVQTPVNIESGIMWPSLQIAANAEQS